MINRQSVHGRNPALLVLGCLAVQPALTHAQTEPEGSRQRIATLEEIIVTAQKREQNLFEVPMSISAITGEEIDDRGITSLEDLQYSIPGLSMTEFSPGQQRIQIRGISSALGLPTVGRYLDEMAINTEAVQDGLDVRLIDMARVEVLRGPQGTLYGQGSMGGTVKYVTASPDLNEVGFEFDGRVRSVDGGGDGVDGSAVLNLPIAEGRFGLRFVAAYEELPGWVDNSTTGEQDVNSGDVTTFRTKALWQPTEDFRAELLWQHEQMELDSMNFADENGQVPLALPTPLENDYDVFNLVLEHDFENFTLLSSSGYLERNASNQFDVSAFYVPVLETPPPFGLGFPPGTFSGAALGTDSGIEIVTQEIRFATTTNGSFYWTGGLYYRDSDTRAVTDSFTVPDVLPFEIFGSTNNSPSDSQSWSAFSEFTYAFSERVEATVGLRYFEDEREQDVMTTNFGVVAVDRQSETFDTVNPRFNLSYRVSDSANFYFNAAKGFRSGGFNVTSAGLGVFEIPPSYEPEELWTYEIGTKLRLAEDRVNLETAVYYNDWTDVQSSEFAPGSPIIVVVNSGEASGWGLDFLLDVVITEQLEINLTAGYIDAEFGTTTATHLEGDPLDYVPKVTGSVSGTYRFDWTSTLPGIVRLDYQYQDKFDILLRNLANSVVESDSLSFLNARVGIEKDNWQLYVEGKNLLDEDGVVYPAVGVSLVPVRPEPQSVGLNFRFQY